jgi:hypothetical protein
LTVSWLELSLLCAPLPLAPVAASGVLRPALTPCARSALLAVDSVVEV